MSEKTADSLASKTHDDDAAQLLGIAREHHDAGRLDEAAIVYGTLLARLPGNADVLHRLGVIRHQQGRHDEAIELIGKAVALTPKPANEQNSLGSALLAAGRAEEAVEAFRRATDVDENFAEAHYNLGTALRARNQLEEALQCFARAIDIQPSVPEAHLNLGVSLAMAGRHEEAMAAIRRALDLNPELGPAHFHLGLVRRALGRRDEAGAAFEAASELLPHFVPAHEALLAELERVGSGDVSAARTNLGTALLANGRANEALALFDANIAACAGSIRDLAHKSVSLLALGKREAARELVNFDRFVRTVRIDCPAEFENLQAFNRALAEHVLAHPSLEWEKQDHATRHGYHSDSLWKGQKGPVAQLEAVLEPAIRAYFEALPTDPGHPFTAHGQPTSWAMNSWAVVLGAQGYQLPHLHAEAWLSGVYYVQLPEVVAGGDGEHAGWLEFGEPSEDFPLEIPDADVHLVQPQEGLLVLFPSYFYHRTIPFKGDGTRISIAIDVCRQRPGD